MAKIKTQISSKQRNQGRNRNGKGTVYAEGIKSGKPMGFFIAEIQWTDADGRGRRRSAKRSTIKGANRELDRWYVEIASRGTMATAEQRALTVRAALDLWMEEAKGRVQATTYQQYEFIRKHLGSVEDRRIATLTRSDIQHVMQSAGSERMAFLCRLILKAALRAHIESLHNLFPIRSAPPKGDERTMTAWNANEARRFLDATKGDRHHLLYRTAIETGLRQGELIALRWRNVNPRWIEVVGTYNRANGGIKPPKTRGSSRRIAISGAFLRHWRQAVATIWNPCSLPSLGACLVPATSFARSMRPWPQRVRLMQKEALETSCRRFASTI